MKVLPYGPEAYKLLHDGAIALAQVEANGMRVDMPYLETALSQTQAEIAELRGKLRESKVAKVWRRHFRSKTNFGSHEQLGKVLFDVLKIPYPEVVGYTDSGRYRTDEATLGYVDNPFVVDFLAVAKKKKGIDFLVGIRRQVCGGILRPSFNLHLVVTFRSSSDSPNFQNLPVRNEWMKNLVRRCIVARKGHRIVEIDYSGVEVRVACCYHKDPTMQTYIEDPTTDMHRDMAMECYLLKEPQVTKDVRYCAKNKFVFPEFYGAWWLDCSAALWEAIDVMKLKTVKGTPLKDHLRRKGIVRLGDQRRKNPHPAPGTFEAHIQKVEKHFWGKRFPVYAEWKQDWYDDYLKKGWFRTLTGFICQGHMAKNDVINYPVQGSAFHLLLWVLIRLVRVELRKRRMRAKVIGQIHDSIVADVPDEEHHEYVALVRHLMAVELPKVWKWITVPLGCEAEVTPVGGSWVEKEEYKG